MEESLKVSAMEPQVVLEEQNEPKDLTPIKRRSPVKKTASVVSTSTVTVEEKPEVPVVDPKEEAKRKIEFQRQRDSEVVRIRFVNNEQPGALVEFPYKAYKQDPLKVYRFEHGGVYDVPFGVAQHLNYNCSTPVYEYLDTKMIAGHNPDKNKAFKVTSLQNRFTAVPINYRETDYEGPTCNRVIIVEALVENAWRGS